MWKPKKNHTTRLLALLLAAVLCVGSFAGCGKKEEPATTATTVPTTKPAPVYRNPLTGEAGYDKALLGNRPVIVSVENSPAARPQWGICSADLVMEMVAEGGITRMLMMYADASRLPDKLGPVRSARHYFVELVQGFDAVFVHCGGSPYAYTEIANSGCDDLDGLKSTAFFFRDKSRDVAIEHTGYTTKESVVQTLKDREIRTTLEEGYEKPFLFSTKKQTLPGGSCVELSVSFSQSYDYTFTFDKQENRYFSALNGTPFTESSGEQQSFTNLVILYTTISDLGDAKQRVTFDLSEGEGIYVSNGSYREITWKKGETADMLKLYDEDGKELSLNVGRTYIGIISSSREGQTVIA